MSEIYKAGRDSEMTCSFDQKGKGSELLLVEPQNLGSLGPLD